MFSRKDDLLHIEFFKKKNHFLKKPSAKFFWTWNKKRTKLESNLLPDGRKLQWPFLIKHFISTQTDLTIIHCSI